MIFISKKKPEQTEESASSGSVKLIIYRSVRNFDMLCNQHLLYPYRKFHAAGRKILSSSTLCIHTGIRRIEASVIKSWQLYVRNWWHRDWPPVVHYRIYILWRLVYRTNEVQNRCSRPCTVSTFISSLWISGSISTVHPSAIWSTGPSPLIRFSGSWSQAYCLWQGSWRETTTTEITG